VELTSPNAVPLANNFGHALIGVDTSSRDFAVALRRAGLPGRVAAKARYRHSRAGAVPSRGRIVVPGRYDVAVAARDLDPTNPHDHANRFEHQRAGRAVSSLNLAIENAIDRFCFPESGSCSVTVRAPRGSALARRLGGRSAKARVGFDHERVRRIDLVLRRGR
jgi:hypothetical protein